MTTANQQIITLYDESGLSVEEIAQELDYEVVAVKAILSSYSEVYKSRNRKDTLTQEEEITDDEKAELLRRMKSIALYSEDENVAARLCRYLYDEKKGRNNIQTIGAGIRGLNVTVINQTISLANNAIKKALKSSNDSDISQKQILELNEVA